MRPSAQALPPAARIVRTHCDEPRFVLDELVDRVARDANVRAPEVVGDACLALERAQEGAGLRQLLPDLRQERGAPPPAFEQHAVDAGPQHGQDRVLVRRRHAARAARAATLRSQVSAKLVARERREARIVERRGDGVGANVLGKRPPRVDRADAAAQLARAPQRHERGAVLAQGRQARPRGARAAERIADRAAREAEQRQAEIIPRAHGRRRRTRRSRRRASDRRRCRRSCAGRASAGARPRRCAHRSKPLTGVAPHACS